MLDKKALDGLALLHDLVPFLPIDRLHALLSDSPLPHEADGAALFADISGFTALEEQLAVELGAERGAEELNQRINRTFMGLIDIVDRYHGSVLRFSGDALTAWFKGEAAALRAATAGLAMQAVMKALTTSLPALRLRVGVGCGTTHRFCPGDPALGVYEVLAGSPVEQMMAAEARAEPGQVVLSPQASAAVGDQLGGEALPDGYKRLGLTVFASRPPGGERWPSIRWMDHVERAWSLVDACRPYLLPPVYQRLVGGHGAYVADLRTASPLFARFTGLDYDAPDAETRLDELVRAAQSIIARYGGFLNEVEVGDKGSVLVALFGAPLALEAPATHAAYCALALRDELPHVTGVHCGLTCGDIFAGTVGSPMRRAYAVIGGSVILSARLMSQAGPNEILADARTPQKIDDFSWEALPPRRIKGRVAPVRVYRLLGLAEITRPLDPIKVFMGRVNELRALQWALEASHAGQARVLLLKGEPGLGKSHLVQEFAHMVQDRGMTRLSGAGRSVERQTPYRAWRDVFARYFELDRRADPDTRREQVQSRLAQIAPEMAYQAPLLNDLLHVGIPENEWTAHLRPSQRHTILLTLLIALLRAWLSEDALVLILDDAQWLDPLSWDLLYEAALNLADYPLAVLVAMRPFGADDDPPRAFQRLEQMDHVRQFWLAPLSAADALVLAAETLGAESLPDPVTQLIVEKAGGNPFFIQEIVSVLRDSDMVRIEQGQAVLTGDLHTLHLPNTVQGLVRSRMDRLPPDQQMLLKVAAVIGPQFAYRTLRDVQPLRLSDDDLRANLDALSELGLQRTESLEGEVVYTFHNTTTREVAYNALLFAQRRQLHRAVAQWLEQEHRDTLTLHYPALVQHWRLAEDRDQEARYCRLAGLQAAAQYMNDDAIGYLERALELQPHGDRMALYGLLTQLESIYHLHADRVKQRMCLVGLSALAEEYQNNQGQAEVWALWARHYRAVAEYARAVEAARAAFEAAQRADSRRVMAQSRVQWGKALIAQGSYAAAQELLSTSLDADNEALEAHRLNILGSALAAQGHYTAARNAHQEALEKSRAAADRLGTAETLGSLGDNHAQAGDYEQGIRCHEDALAIRLSMGDRQGVAGAFYSLGQLALQIGDYETAMHYFAQAYQIYHSIGDRTGEAATVHGVGMLAYQRGDYAVAHECLNLALHARRASGDRAGLRSSLVDLGLVDTALGRSAEAEQLFGEAVAIDRDLGQHSLAAEIYTAWALLALRGGSTAVAQTYVEMALEALDKGGSLDSLELPFQASLNCYEVLIACGDHERARGVLQRAYDLLMTRAGRITDSERQARYLMAVAVHRQIIVLQEKQSPRD